jgi:hypothetical protein
VLTQCLSKKSFLVSHVVIAAAWSTSGFMHFQQCHCCHYDHNVQWYH